MGAESAPMGDHLVRVGRLKTLQRSNGWTDSDLARQCGRTPQQIWAWFSNTRQIGERLARDLETTLGLPRYALDERPQAAEAVALMQVKEGVINPADGRRPPVHATNLPTEAPIIQWADIDTMLGSENARLKARAVHLETYAACSTRAKFLAMPDDSMAEAFSAGDNVLFDPTEAPRAGDVVLVRAGAEHFVRVFRPRTAYIFEAVALNPNYQPLSSDQDGAIVVGVMIEHRRYRRQV